MTFGITPNQPGQIQHKKREKKQENKRGGELYENSSLNKSMDAGVNILRFEEVVGT